MTLVAEGYLMGYRNHLGCAAQMEDWMAEAELEDAGKYDYLAKEREKTLRRAEDCRKELRAFLDRLGDGNDLRVQRYRTALRLYYCELMSWSEVRRHLRPLVLRKGVAEADPRRGPGVSKTAMLRIREEALQAVEEALMDLGGPGQTP